jgi:uncharacterized membrane protein YkvA (DUF1232 family)
LGAFGFFVPGEDTTMMAFDNASDLRNAALGKEISLRKFAEWEKEARTDFWSKVKRFVGQVPFVEDIVDFLPDIIAGLGFADDAALFTAVLALVSAHITPTHRAAAARALDKELPKTT